MRGLLGFNPFENQERAPLALNPGHVHFWLPPYPEPRAWSASVDAADTCSIYTIRAFLGGPDVPLSHHIKPQNKSYLQDLLRRSGVVDVTGTRAALLQRYQAGNYGIPCVQYRIDGRECLQRMLVVCLQAWAAPEQRKSKHQKFCATMPARAR